MMWKGCGKIAGRIYKGVGWVWNDADRKQKENRQVVESCEKRFGWMWKWHGYDEEMIRNDSRKEAEGSRKKTEKRDRNEAEWQQYKRRNKRETERTQTGNRKESEKGKEGNRNEPERKQKLSRD